MKAFNGLFIKEVKVTKNWFLLGIALIFFAVVIGLGLESYLKEPAILAAISLFVFIGHGFYMPMYLLFSLNIEGQSQSWLHNPNSGTKLFLAKLASGFVFFLVSLTIAMLFAGWGLNHAILNENIVNFGSFVYYYSNLLLIACGIILASIYLGIWILFFWSLFHAINSKPAIRAFRWPILIGLWILMGVGSNVIENLPFYQKLKEIGMIRFDSIPSFKIESGESTFSAGLVETAEISIMNGVIYTVVIVAVFVMAVWLLERKVEV